jgi:opacity protein-like surface antigen
MHLRQIVTVSALVIAAPLASVSAQSPTAEPSGQSTAGASGKWSFSVGADPTRLNPSTTEFGSEARMVANLTRSWQSAHSRWTRRISLMVGGDTPLEVQPGIFGFFGPQCDCPERISRRYAGLTAGASYDLFHVSRFTPYLAGGTGIYYSQVKRSPARGFLTPEELPFYQNSFSGSNFSLGANAGLGLKMRFGSHDLFIEQIFHEFDIRNHAAGGAVFPLNIGFRF